MRPRWRKYLPGWPAVLLVPAVLAVWIMLGIFAPEKGLPGSRGFPFDFAVRWEEYEMNPQLFANLRKHFPQEYSQYSEENLPILRRPVRGSGFQISWFLIDLVIALAVAWVLAMIVDRVLFPLARRRSSKEPDRRESNSSTTRG